MNEKFFQLPQEKQLRIINAAMEVFSKNEYKHASTELMATKAGVSKGLLFHYFKNKKELYFYLLDYCEKAVKSQVLGQNFFEITDFFDLLEYSAQTKYKLMEKNPFLLEFAMRSFYSKGEEISLQLNRRNQGVLEDLFDLYFKNIDFSKFQAGIQPQQMLQMLTWMVSGYIQEKQRENNFDLNQMMQDYRQWASLFKKIAYRKEYL